ncbi:MAG: hypothetical protein AB1758_04680, partial [Candidatus Eremiobacterota bacterium]
MTRRGASLVEVLVSMSLFLLIMLVAWATFEMLQRSQMSQDAKVEGRQNTRNLMARLQEEVSNASTYYMNYVGVFGGRAYDTSYNPATGVMREVILAIPEASPAGPQAWQPGRNYRLVGIYTRGLNPPDRLNPGAREVVIHTIPGQPCSGAAPFPNFPSDAPLVTSLSGAASGQATTKVFRCYLPADDPGNNRYFWLIRPVLTGGGAPSPDAL